MRGAEVEPKAYCKLMLHSAQHPSCDVLGVLLGSQDDSRTVVKDAVPLFHLPVLTPMLEVASSLVDAYVRESDLKMVGTYYATATPEDMPGPPTHLPRVATKLCEKLGDRAVLLQQNHKKLDAAQEHALLAFERDSGGNYRRALELSVDSASVTAFNGLLLANSVPFVRDMDDHLDDVTKDWRNKTLEAAIL
ncbi:COX4 neighbour [Tribonema minus]|uniref:COX4 neighbour n=1 Tax=Tribonema minus TaxID=303371 RepID=A0A835YUA8_9STRA|nr:COX4 neighbour [Tribonema minus]